AEGKERPVLLEGHLLRDHGLRWHGSVLSVWGLSLGGGTSVGRFRLRKPKNPLRGRKGFGEPLGAGSPSSGGGGRGSMPSLRCYRLGPPPTTRGARFRCGRLRRAGTPASC